MSSVESVRAALDAAADLQPKINAFTMLFRERALQEAERADASAPRGVLHGVPVVVKDLFDMAGEVTSGCSRAYASNVALSDAPVIKRLRQSGAIIIGKANMHELAFGATGEISSIGPANNPWDPSRVTGGSSSGSAAAVAAGIVGIALGSDTGGSVRIPGSLCGVSALKTTHGLLSLQGVLPLALSLDTVGPIASDAEQLSLAMTALCGTDSDERDDLNGVTIGIPTGPYSEEVDSEVAAAVAEAAVVLERAGATLRDVEIPEYDRASHAWAQVALPEFLNAHGSADASLMHPDIAALLAGARDMSPADYQTGLESMPIVRDAFAKLFTTIDALLGPSTPFTALPHGPNAIATGGVLSSKTRLANVPGIPAIALPCGLDSQGLPIGLQIAGPRDSESFLLGLGTLYQRLTTHHHAHPPLYAG